jgi:hypothetical protein
MIGKPDGTRFVSPVVGVHGAQGRDAWVRPGELLVDVRAEARLRERLRKDGQPGGPYRPKPGDENDWRQRRGAPDYGDINARLRQYGVRVRLWTGLSHEYALGLVNERMKGVHLHHVLVGEDFYHGGPGGPPAAVPGPTSLPAYSGDGKADIAVLDNGVPRDWDVDYGDLKHSVQWYDEKSIPEDPLDENHDGVLDEQAGHGVFICGLIARVLPQSDVDLHRVLHATGEGDEALIMATLAALATSTVRVVNLSLGGYTVDDTEPPLADTVRTLTGAGKFVVAAAGNAGDDPALSGRPFWPAAMPEVIAVGAYDSTNGSPAQWSRSCGGDIYAPGVDLRSNYVWSHGLSPAFDGWARWSGTSFATPLVAAKIAELLAGALSGSAQDVVEDWRASLPSAAPWPNKPGSTGDARRYEPAEDTTVWP